MTKSLFAADADFLTEAQARALAQRVLSFAKADMELCFNRID